MLREPDAVSGTSNNIMKVRLGWVKLG